METLLPLFWSFFQIGLFSVGGGYAAMPLIKYQVTEVHNWLSMQEFADIITIAEMTPGPVAINSATFVGIRTAGLPGALIATLGCVLPSCVIVMLLAYIYVKYRDLAAVRGVLTGLRPAVVAMIASAGLSILYLVLFKDGTDGLHYGAGLLFLACFLVLRRFKVSPIAVILAAGACGLALSLFLGPAAM